nr:(Fe-S)-binding protein [Micromonospora coriariae]
MADPEICCGSAGIWNILHPGPAAELGDRKARTVLATGARLLVTANPGCLMQVAASVTRAGGDSPRRLDPRTRRRRVAAPENPVLTAGYTVTADPRSP